MKLGGKVEGEGHATRRVEVSRCLSNAQYTGFSDKTSYLLAHPAQFPADTKWTTHRFCESGDRSVLPIARDGRWLIEW
jgi:hypothetical protein